MRSPDGWFEIAEIADGVIALSEHLGQVDRFGRVWTHTYLVKGEERWALIDASHGIGDLRAAVRAVVGEGEVACLLTHYHFDHIGCAHQFDQVAIAEAEAALLMDEPTAEMLRLTREIRTLTSIPTPPGFSFDDYRIPPVVPSRRLQEGDTIDLGGRALQVLHTPGHSPGSVCFHDPASGWLFTGDTANRGMVTLSLELSDLDAYARSLARLAGMGAAVGAVFPAHWATPIDLAALEDLAAASALAAAGELEAPRTDLGTGIRAELERFSIVLPRDRA